MSVATALLPHRSVLVVVDASSSESIFFLTFEEEVRSCSWRTTSLSNRDAQCPLTIPLSTHLCIPPIGRGFVCCDMPLYIVSVLNLFSSNGPNLPSVGHSPVNLKIIWKNILILGSLFEPSSLNNKDTAN